MPHVITPRRGLFDIDIKGLWRYRDLYWMYVHRDIVTRYKQTILGPLWYVIQPVFTTAIYMFVFGGLAGISTDGVPQPLFYLSGILLWNYFSECFDACSDVFGSNAGVFGKVYFPRLVVPLSAITSNLLKMLIQLLLFVSVYCYFKFFTPEGQLLSLSVSLLSFPLLILLLGMLAMASGLIFSSLTTKYRDLKFLIGFGIQLLMYATPVIYPMSAAPKEYANILRLNPLTPIFEAFRYSCLGCGSLDWGGLLYSTLFMLVTLFLSVVIFSRTERDFMDTV